MVLEARPPEAFDTAHLPFDRSMPLAKLEHGEAHLAVHDLLLLGRRYQLEEWLTSDAWA